MFQIYSKPRQFQKDDSEKKHGIKLAFISACQSEEIGNIFHKAGIPIVIAVNANQEIADQACKLFSSIFYTRLLSGSTIGESFEQARTHIQLSGGDFSVCCCAHDHDPDCEWYQFYQEDPIKAHEMHSKECFCGHYKYNT